MKGRGPGKILREVMDHVAKKPATEMYPQNKVGMPEGFRGKLKFIAGKCVGCKLCMKDCPSGAITINKIGEKQFEAVLDLSKCIYCAQCVESCARKALDYTGNFELAQINRGKLKVVLDEGQTSLLQDPPAKIQTPSASIQQNPEPPKPAV